MACLSAAHGDPTHEKARFAVWTIAAQGSGAKDRLSLERAIPRLKIDWEDSAFAPLKEVLTAAAS